MCRQKLLLEPDDDPTAGGKPVYINPLSPPQDPRHSCWCAQCYVLELRAELGDLLIIPAGMLHFVLTLEDSAMICVEMASILPFEISASLHVLETVRQLTFGAVAQQDQPARHGGKGGKKGRSREQRPQPPLPPPRVSD